MAGEIRESEDPSQAVKRIIAGKERCRPSQLGNLDDAVDVNRLEALRDPPIEFHYSGYQVEVTADQTIRTDP